MSVRPEELAAIPLFRGITREHIDELLSVLTHRTLDEGEVLFRAGDLADKFQLLASGDLSLVEDGTSRFLLRAVAPIGELGALTGAPRSATAVAATKVEVLEIPSTALMDFFERRGEVAFPFYHNLLGVVADKVRRDLRHMHEMAENIVRTQKAMKQLREVVLAAPENELSKPAVDMLEDCIEHNRRAHYRLSPVSGYPIEVRLDDGRVVSVIEVSDEHLHLACPVRDLFSPGSIRAGGTPGSTTEEWCGVLVIPAGEIPVAGTVQRDAGETVVVKLAELVGTHRAQFHDFLTRLQMLDFVV